MLATDFAAKGLPRSFRKLRAVSSLDTARQRQLAPFGTLAAQPTGDGDNLGLRLAMGLPSLATPLALTLPLTSRCKFRNATSLLELSYGP